MKGSREPGIVLHPHTQSNEIDGPVYPVREDSLLLTRHSTARPEEEVLEIGCGRGVAALSAARIAKRVVATDLNPFALKALRAEARRQRLLVEPIRTDLATGLGKFDLVLCNPPYLPTPPEARDEDRWTDLALNGGKDGCETFGRVVDALEEHLRPKGRALVVVSSLQDRDHVRAILRGHERRCGTVLPVDYEEFSDEYLSLLEFRRTSSPPSAEA